MQNFHSFANVCPSKFFFFKIKNLHTHTAENDSFLFFLEIKQQNAETILN